MADIERKYPLSNQTFQDVIEEGYYYVDKTELLYKLANNYKYAFLSRPRRFGKSMLCSTLAAYFQGKKKLFRGLAIEQMETSWKAYPVIHISLAEIKEIKTSEIRKQLYDIIEEQEELMGVETKGRTLSSRFKSLIISCHKKYGEKVVVILDEYDVPLLNVLHDNKSLEKVRQVMRTFYSPLKVCDPYLKFVFITGITKFSQLSIFSEINNLKVVSMLHEFSTICGFTQTELEQNFQTGIHRLAETKGITWEQALELLRQNYDGYHFSANAQGVYNPYSIINALSDGEVKNHWFATGTPTFLVNMLKKFNTNISDVENTDASSEEFDAPTEDMHSVLPLFYQSGYLTIKGYDPEFSIYTLGYPNKEVKTGMMKALYPFFVTPKTDGRADVLRSICKGFMLHDLNLSFDILYAYLESIPYQDSHFDENHWTQMLYVVFSLLGMHVESQVRTAKGRIDIIVKTKNDIYVMEVKLDRPAREALEQIDKKEYLIPYTLDGRKLTKIGISFSTEQHNIAEWVV